MRINVHGFLSICLILMMGGVIFFRQWNVNWEYVGGAMTFYGVSIIILSIAREDLRRRRSILLSALDQNLTAYLQRAIGQSKGRFLDSIAAILNADRFQNRLFDLLRWLVGMHLGFGFVIATTYFKLDMLPKPSHWIVFVACWTGGVAIPYLLLSRKDYTEGDIFSA